MALPEEGCYIPLLPASTFAPVAWRGQPAHCRAGRLPSEKSIPQASHREHRVLPKPGQALAVGAEEGHRLESASLINLGIKHSLAFLSAQHSH